MNHFSSSAASAEAAAAGGGGEGEGEGEINPTGTSIESLGDDSAQSINWGIVGLGDVCTKKSGPAFYKCQGSNLVAVTRRTPGKAQEYAQSIPIQENNNHECKGYENLEAFLQHPNLDAVYVSTHPGTHLKICTMVARAKKACYVEKPVGRCAQETNEIVRLFQKKEEEEEGDIMIPLYTAYISRAYEKTNLIRTLLLTDNRIGSKIHKISYINVGNGGARNMNVSEEELPWRLNATESGGGLLMDVGCHVLDRLEYICNAPLVNIDGYAENRNSPGIQVEDYVHLTGSIGLSFLDDECGEKKQITSDDANNNNNNNKNPTEGAKLELTWDFGSEESPSDELIFHGTRGYLKTKGGYTEPLFVYNEHDELVQEYTFDALEHVAQPMIQLVTKDLINLKLGKQNADRKCLSFGDNAIRTQHVMDTVLSSYYGGREIGFWNRMDTWRKSTVTESAM